MAHTDRNETERTARRNQRAAQRRRQVRRRLVVLIVLALLAAAFLAFYIYMAPSREKMDSKTYYETMMMRAAEEAGTADAYGSDASAGNGSDTGVTLADGELAVVLQDHVCADKALVEDNVLYLNYTMVREQISTRLYYDSENDRMLCTAELTTMKFPVDSTTYTSDGEEQTMDHPVAIRRDETLYVQADFLQEQVNAEVIREDENWHVVVNYDWGERETAVVKRACSLRYRGGIMAPILTKVSGGDTVYVLEQLEDWSYVVTQDGFIGYLPNKRLGEVQSEEYTHEFAGSTFTGTSLEETVNLAWHQIGSQDGNKSLLSTIEGVTGVNVISPTWFSLSDNEGNFTSYASRLYVTRAHRQGLQVWGLISNFSPDMSTAELLSSENTREVLISNLIEAAQDVGMDGFNLDFEYITEDMAYDYVQFVREFSVACRKNSLVLSVDLPVALDYNAYYDRAELGVFADYLIIMGYDEHYSGSEAGSVASISFEENGILGTLESAPAAKVISAVPFYTRIWYTQDGTVWSEVLSMDTVDTTLETYSITPVWDETTGQNYAEWTLENGIVCRIWIEDEESLALKADLVSTYSLGGIAEWALGFEKDSVWAVIAEHIAA